MSSQKVYRRPITAAAASASLPIILPGQVTDLAVAALPGASSTMNVQVTLDDPVAVEATPASANWIDWDPGAVAVNTIQAVAGAITAVRGVAAGPNGGDIVVAGFYK